MEDAVRYLLPYISLSWLSGTIRVTQGFSSRHVRHNEQGGQHHISIWHTYRQIGLNDLLDCHQQPESLVWTMSAPGVSFPSPDCHQQPKSCIFF